MKIFAIVILFCVTFVFVATEYAWKDYVLDKQRLDIQQQQLQLDILKYINAQNDKLERENKTAPVPQRPSLDLRHLSFPRDVVPSSGRNGPLPEIAQRQPRPQRFLASNAAYLPAREISKG
jgi:hypothetical protein